MQIIESTICVLHYISLDVTVIFPNFSDFKNFKNHRVIPCKLIGFAFQKEVEVLEGGNTKSQSDKLFAVNVPDEPKEYESTTDGRSRKNATRVEETTKRQVKIIFFITI